MKSNSLEKLVKAAAVYQLPDLSVIGKNNEIHMVVRDKKNDTSNEYSIYVGETDSTFELNFKMENIKIILSRMMLLYPQNYFLSSQINNITLNTL